MGDDLIISLRTEADVKQLNDAIKSGAIKTIDDFISYVKKLGGALDDSLGEARRLVIEGRVNGLPQFKQLTNTLTDAEKAEAKLRRAIEQRAKADKGSLTNIRQRLNQAKQVQAALSQENAQYERQTQIINELTVALRRAQGIEAGSIADIGFNIKDAERRLQIENLSADARRELTEEINRYNQVINKAKGIEEGSVAALRQQQAEQQRLADTLKIGSAAQLQAANNVKRLGDEIGRATPKTFSLIGAFNKLATVQAGLTAIVSAFGQVSGSIDQFVKRLKQVEAFELALTNVGLSASETARYFAEASNTAQGLGAPLESVEKAYKRITPSLESIGVGAEKTNGFIKALTARTVTLGLSSEESGRYVEAFAQVLSKGRLQSEELNQQIAELDGGFRNQLAKSLNVTTAELTKMVEEGEVVDTVFVDAFLNMSNGVDELEGRLQNGNATIQQLQNNINNINVKTLEEIGKLIEPGIRALLEAGAAFAQFVQDVAKSPVGELLGEIFNNIAQIVNVAVQTFTALFRAVSVVLNPLAKLLTVLSPLIALLITLKTATLAASAAQAVLKAALGGLGTSALAATFNTGLLTKGISQLAAGFRALLALRVQEGLAGIGAAIGNMLKFMNIPLVNGFVDALSRLVKVRSASDALNAIGISASTFGGFAQGLGDIVNNLGFSFGRVAGSVKGFGLTLSKNIKDFFRFGKAADGTKIAFDGVGRAAANATVDVSATAATVGREVVPALGKVGKTAGLANGSLAASAGSAVGLGRALGALLGGVAAGAALTAAMAAVAQVMSGASQASSATRDSIKTLEGTMRQLGIQTSTTNGIWLGWLDNLKKVPFFDKVGDAINDIGDRLKALGLAIGGGQGLDQLADKFKDIEKAARESGVKSLDDFSNASKLSGAEATKLVGGLRAQEKAALEMAAAYETQIAELEKSGGATSAQLNNLKFLQQASQDAADKANYYATQWERVTEEQRKTQPALELTGNAMKDVAAAQALYFNSIDTDKQQQINALQDQFSKGLISSATFAQQSASINEQATQKKLDAIAKERAALEARGQTSKEVDYAAFRRLQELDAQEAALRSGKAASVKALTQEQIAALQAQIEKYDELGTAIQGISTLSSSAIGDLASDVGGALDSLASAIEQRAVIEFTFTGDQSFLTQTLDNQAKILDFQYTIGEVKIKQQQAEKAFELELQALKIQTAKIEAEARAAETGDPIALKMVEAYQKQLDLIPLIRQANDVTSEAALIGLKAETQEKQDQLNLARTAQGIPPVQIVDTKSAAQLSSELDGLASKGKNIAGQIGQVATKGINEGVGALSQGLNDAEVAVNKTAVAGEAAGATFEKAIGQLTEGIEKLANNKQLKETLTEGVAGGVEKVNKESEKTKTLFDGIASAAKAVGDNFLNTINPITKVQKELNTTISLVRSLSDVVGNIGGFGNARAMGGPVAGGQTYFVNDGGGREAFMNRAGQISLLPAARNIQWRAPGDGFIIPAPMTQSLIQNSKINAKIAATAKTSGPSAPGSYASGMANSGNLIQQMGAMMGSATTQRITNHVTIQSQSPVMDASKIMANVARMQARRGLKG